MGYTSHGRVPRLVRRRQGHNNEGSGLVCRASVSVGRTSESACSKMTMSPSWISGCALIGLSAVMESSRGRGDGFTSSNALRGVHSGRPTFFRTYSMDTLISVANSGGRHHQAACVRSAWHSSQCDAGVEDGTGSMGWSS